MTIHSQRAEHEIAHGRSLAESGAEEIWGWGTAAGKARARRRAGWIAAAGKLRPGARVLEIGCGTGLFTEFFAASGATILAVDISEDLLASARRRGLPPTVTFACMPFEHLDSRQPFDAIIGSSVLHHLDIDAALKQIFRLLAPRGLLAFAEPNMLNPQIMVQSNVPALRKRMGYSPDETAFLRWQIRRRLARAGFVDVCVVPRDWLHPSMPPSLIGAVKRVEDLLEHLPLIREFAGSVYMTGRRPA